MRVADYEWSHYSIEQLKKEWSPEKFGAQKK